MVIFPTSSIELDIGAALESDFPSFRTSDATALYMYRRSHSIAYPYLVQRSHNVLEKNAATSKLFFSVQDTYHI